MGMEFKGIDGRLDDLEKKEEERFTTLSDHSKTLEKKMVEQAAVSSSISNNVIETLSSALTLKARQEAQRSEIQLISLYKGTGQNNPKSGSLICGRSRGGWYDDI
jgi:hypothetical protein